MEDFRRWQELFFGVKTIERVPAKGPIVEESKEDDDDEESMMAEMDEDFTSQNI